MARPRRAARPGVPAGAGRRAAADPRRRTRVTRADARAGGPGSRARRSPSAWTRCWRTASSTRPATAQSTGGRPPDARSPSTTTPGVVLAADLGATHSRLAVSDLAARSARRASPATWTSPRARSRCSTGSTSASDAARGAGRRHDDVRGIGVGVPGPVAFAPAGRATRRSCPAGTASRSRSWFAERYGVPGAGRQRREHHGPGRALDALARRSSTCCSSRSAPASAAASSPTGASTAAPRARPATSATSACTGRRRRGLPLRQHRLPRGGRRRRRARRAGSPRPGSTAPTAATSSRLVRGGQPAARSASCARPGALLGEVLAACVNFFNPARDRASAATSAQAHEQLLAGMREVVFQRSLPLATRRPARSCRASSATAPA